jgi:hypothetical protein
MIDYKNTTLSFSVNALNQTNLKQHTSALLLIVMYRAVLNYKSDHIDIEPEQILKDLKEITDVIKFTVPICIRNSRYVRLSAKAKQQFDIQDDELPIRNSNIGCVYFLYYQKYGTEEGLFFDREECYRILLEMYMDMEVSLNGFYFYTSYNSWVYKKCKKYNIMWDIPMRNVIDLQPLYNMSNMIKDNPK